MRKRKDRPKRRFRFSLPARPTAQVFRNGSAATVLTVLAVAAVVLVNLIGNALPASVSQFDLSETKLYTLGDVSLGILDELEQDVTIYYLAQTGSVDSNVTALLDQYAGHSSHIQWQQKDPALYPGFARQMGVEDATDGSLIVVSGDRTRLVDSSVLYSSEFDYDTYSYTTSFDAENQITSAVQYVTGGELPVVYQLTGHGEATLSDGVQQALGLQNLELQELNLLTSDIPEDAYVLVIYAPSSDFAAEDVEALRSWLLDGGRMLVCTDPGVDTPNLNSLMEDWGLSLIDGLVIEGSSSYHLQGASYYLLPDQGSHAINDAVDDGLYVLAPEAQAIRVADELPEGVTVSELLTTSDSAYIKSEGYDMTTLDKEDGDETGSFVLAAAASRTVTGASDGEETDDTEKTAAGTSEAESRLVWLSCPMLLMTDDLDQITMGGNGQFALGCLTWLADQDTTALIAAKSLMLEGLSLSSGQVTFWAGVFMVAVPLVLLILGITVTLKRRRR